MVILSSVESSGVIPGFTSLSALSAAREMQSCLPLVAGVCISLWETGLGSKYDFKINMFISGFPSLQRVRQGMVGPLLSHKTVFCHCTWKDPNNLTLFVKHVKPELMTLMLNPAAQQSCEDLLFYLQIFHQLNKVFCNYVFLSF